MPLFDEAVLLGLSRETPLAVSGPAAPPSLQVGGNIPDDKVRRVWRVNVQNLDPVAPHILTIYAGDALNTQRRLIINLPIAIAAANDFPINRQHVKSPYFVVQPITSVAPTQQNGIYISDEGAGGLINVVMSQYDLRG